MAIAANVEHFLFSIEGVDERLRVLRFNGSEGINQLYNYRIEVTCDSADLDLDALLGMPAAMTCVDGYERVDRYIHGIVFEAQFLGSHLNLSRYQLRIGSVFKLLNQRKNCRIFQYKTVPAIIKQLLEEAGITAAFYQFKLQEDHPEHEYCVQFQETEYDFIHRLLEEEGMIYYFEHTPDVAKLVLADGNAAHEQIPSPDLLYHEPTGMVAQDEQTVHSLYPQSQIQSGTVTMRDYTFEKPTLNLHVHKQADDHKPLEVYLYPGGYEDKAVVKSWCNTGSTPRGSKPKPCKARAPANACWPDTGSTWTNTRSMRRIKPM